MCGRYTLTSPAEAAAALRGLLADDTLPAALPPRFNIAPTQPALVVANRAAPRFELFRWGLVPRWADDLAIGAKLINARAETAAGKPAFQGALARRRCLVVADGFFEWRAEGKLKQPLWIRREPRRVVCFAGLWDTWRPRGSGSEPLHSFAILTTTPAAVVAPIHDRMPVVLDEADWVRWLSPEAVPAEALADLLVPSRLADLVALPVSRAVNAVANDGPDCVASPAQTRLF